MRNTGSQEGEKWAAVKTKANTSTGNKMFGDHIRQFFEKMMRNKEVSRYSRAKQRQRNVQKYVLQVQICIFC